MKRTLAILLAALLTLAALAGCATGSTTAPPATSAPAEATQTPAEASPAAQAGPEGLEYLNLDDTFPIIKDGFDVTLDIVCPATNANIDPSEHWIWSHFKQNANLNFNVKYIDATGWAEQVNLIFSSKDLPDIFYGAAFSRDQIVRYGQVEGMFYDLTDLIPKYAPMVQLAFSKFPEAAANCTTPDGKMYTLLIINDGDEEFLKSTSRVFIHQTWLDKLGLKNPDTLDQFTEVLRAFKTGDPNGNGQADEIPLMSTYEKGYSHTPIVLSALGINSTETKKLYLRDDGKVALPFMEPNYAEYLKYTKMLLDEGLLPSDYFTLTAEQAKAQMAGGAVGVSAMGAPFVEDPEHYKDYDALNPLTSSFNSTKAWPLSSNRYRVGDFSIAYDTEYPEVCIRFADAHFTQDGPILYWTGQYDGYKYTIDGWDVMTYVPSKDNPEMYETVLPTGDVGTWDWLTQQIRPYYAGQPIGYGDYTGACEKVWGHKRTMIDEEKAWRGAYEAHVQDFVKPVMPDLYYTPEKLDRKTALETPIFDYLKTMESKYLMGTEPLDDMTAFYDQMKSLGIEEYLAIVQEAYDTYKAALE